PRLARAFERAPRRAGTPDVARLVRLVQCVLRRVYRRDFCLPQSLILFHFLSGWDQPVRLCLGVRKAGHGISGHAWIELDGRPLAERRDPREAYHVTFTHPNPSERSSY